MKKINSTVRIGIIGAGNITKTRHLPGFRKIPGVQLVAICNRSETSSLAVAREWSFERIERVPSKIIQADDIDAVIIGTWPYLHHTLSCEALNAGKHVFTQARMARNLSGAKRMLTVSRRHPKLVAMICPSPCAMKTTLFVQQLLQHGFVGKIRLVQLRALNSLFADSDTPIHWRQQFRLSGVNTLSFGIIMERFLQWFGPVDWVQAAKNTFTRLRKDSFGKKIAVSVPDQLQVIAQLRDHPGQLNLSFSGAVYHASHDQVEIYGDRGTLTINLVTDEILGARSHEEKLKPLIAPKKLRREWAVEADFIDAIRAGGQNRLSKERKRFLPPDFKDGVGYMALT